MKLSKPAKDRNEQTTRLHLQFAPQVSKATPCPTPGSSACQTTVRPLASTRAGHQARRCICETSDLCLAKNFGPPILLMQLLYVEDSFVA